MSRVALVSICDGYGGGAGVAVGFAAFDVRRNGLAYVARYRKSTFKPF